MIMIHKLKYNMKLKVVMKRSRNKKHKAGAEGGVLDMLEAEAADAEEEDRVEHRKNRESACTRNLYDLETCFRWV